MLVTLVVTLLAGLIASAVLTPIVRAVARRHGLVVRPRDDRWHTTPTALYGGVAIVAATLVGVCVVLIFRSAAIDSWLLAIGAVALIQFIVGVIDDARGVSPRGKTVIQLLSCGLLIWAGIVYPLTPWFPVNVLATLVWFVLVTNAMNLLDNMDGVSAGVAACAAAGFALLFAASGATSLAVLAMAVAGAAAGFLVYNFKPASIFMGDSGSLFIGAALAGLGAAYPVVAQANPPGVIFVPVLVLLVPLMDTTLVTFARTLNNRSIAVGGRDHTTHRLVAMGLTERRVAMFLYAVCVASVGVAWSVAHALPDTGLWVAIVFVTGAFVFTSYLGTLYKYDVDAGTPELRRRGEILRRFLLKSRGLAQLLDVVLFGAAWYGAFLLNYEDGFPPAIRTVANASVVGVIVLKVLAFRYFRVYAAAWHRPSLADLHRIVRAVVFSSLAIIAVFFVVARGAQVSRTVFLLDLLLTGTLTLAVRTSFSSLDRIRHRLRPDAAIPALIYGANGDAELVLDAMTLRPESNLRPIAFVHDNGDAPGAFIQGIPVVGIGDDLRRVVVESGAAVVVCANRSPMGEVARRTFAELEIAVMQFRAEFTPAVVQQPKPSTQAVSAGGH